MTDKDKINLISEMISSVIECTDFDESAKEALVVCIEAVILADNA